jgi:hypothetical protein
VDFVSQWPIQREEKLVDFNTLCHGLVIVSYCDLQISISNKSREMTNLPETTGPPKDFDTLLVSEYITEHLGPSQLDDFFDGNKASDPPSVKTPPTFCPKNMKDLLSQAKGALESVKKGIKVDTVSHSLWVTLKPS